MLLALKGSIVVTWSGLDTETSRLSILSSMIFTRGPLNPRMTGRLTAWPKLDE